jgi:hypothetical protein
MKIDDTAIERNREEETTKITAIQSDWNEAPLPSIRHSRVLLTSSMLRFWVRRASLDDILDAVEIAVEKYGPTSEGVLLFNEILTSLTKQELPGYIEAYNFEDDTDE